MYLGETVGIAPDGSSYTLREDELRTSLHTFFTLGDREYRSSQWFQPGLHGSPQQRILAFTTGFIAKSLDQGVLRDRVNGLDWCLGYAEYQPGAYTSIGPYRLLGPPGRPGSWSGDTWTIASRPAPAFPSSPIEVRWVPGAGMARGADDARLVEVLAAALPGVVTAPLGEVAVRTGSGVASELTRPLADGGVVEGVAALVVPPAGDGGLLIIASRERPAGSTVDAEEDLARFLEQAIAVNQIVTRLCSPGESEDPGVTEHNAICLTEVQ
jgi:hypothetical protein